LKKSSGPHQAGHQPELCPLPKKKTKGPILSCKINRRGGDGTDDGRRGRGIQKVVIPRRTEQSSKRN